MKTEKLISASDDGTIYIWNLDWTVKRTLEGHTEPIVALVLLQNGDLVSASFDDTIKFWDIENGTIKKEIKVNSTINALEVLPNGDLVSTSDESILIW